MPNRLAKETSPYLLQHKDNPVDWWPWSDEALEKARREDKPILLSIGYAACHWCHVMAHESFEDVATADLMNESFVCVKVDREERPDIDALYMEAVQAMTGQGGWPMTVFLTPGGEPFYGGTYFPPTDRHGLPAFSKLLAAIAETWEKRRQSVEQQSRRLVEHIAAAIKVAPASDPITSEPLSGAAQQLLRSFDSSAGGFGGAPKFPQPMLIDLCTRLAVRGHAGLDEVANATLDAMASGGIFDQLGGGFHRYSVDRTWIVPHFEKMLYDNAQLVRTYARAWQRTGDERYRDVATATARWMLDEMRDPNGGFYSSLDADSEGVEGRFYVWDLDEVRPVLGDHFEAAVAEWGFTPEGNFEGKNIPVDLGRARDRDAVRKAAQMLLAKRSGRVRPQTDTKVLAAWNGLAAAGLTEAGMILDRPSWIAAASGALSFVLGAMRVEGRIMRSFGRDDQGEPRLGPPGFCDDYAFTLEAALQLFEATGDLEWLRRAREVADAALELFWDTEAGGFFTTGIDQERLILRSRDVVDNAVPSANSVMALELQRLALLTGERAYEARAENTMRSLIGATRRAPMAFGNLLAAVDFYTDDPKEIVVIEGERSDEMFDALRSTYVPNRVLIRASGDTVARLAPEVPLVRDRTTVNGATTVYVCRRGVCELPVTDAHSLREQLLR
ncbi:MAG: thioredoxin domain-containing protein [Actinomycetota bacterium]|nr:thioredoxin domain-containing protein [Actinomycetota bacterium]